MYAQLLHIICGATDIELFMIIGGSTHSHGEKQILLPRFVQFAFSSPTIILGRRLQLIFHFTSYIKKLLAHRIIWKNQDVF